MATPYTNKKANNIKPGDIVAAPAGPMIVRSANRDGKWMNVAGRDIATGKNVTASYRTDETVAVRKH